MSENATSVILARNRWIVVVGAVLIQLCLGAIYAWSAFTGRLTATVADGGYGFSTSQTQWVFSAGLATFALVMLFAGSWQAKIGPRAVAMTGGVVLGVGYMLGGLVGGSFWPQLVCVGLIGGTGIGLAYVVPIAVGVKWFPDKKGMITGLAVAGFGFGATIWVKLAGEWFGGLLNTTHALGLPGVQSVFFIYGMTFLVLVLLGSLVMVNPPPGWAAPITHTKAAKLAATHTVNDWKVSQMMTKPQYWALLSMFTGSAMAGLMVIGVIRLFGVDRLTSSGAAVDVAAAGAVAGTAMAWLAMANGAGRIIWGTISDQIGRRAALVTMCLLQGATLAMFFSVAGTKVGLIVAAALVGFNFGGNFALFPAATADLFGVKSVGSNYPWVFLAYGVAGLVGPRLAGHFKDLGGDVASWRTPLLIASVACFGAAALGLVLHAPGRKVEARGLVQSGPAEWCIAGAGI